jgi:pimeloyl-ACP methyl ester carboxylesterase
MTAGSVAPNLVTYFDHSGGTVNLEASAVQAEGHQVHANGIDIHYVEAGQGEPLILLHGGVVSTNLIWEGVPIAYASHMGALAKHFRVIAPDTRGCGKTPHSGGATSFAQLADDVVALIEALNIERPLITGFSEGAITATIVGIRTPGSVRAIVNDAGYDFFNPNAPSYAMCRQMLGGSPEATEADPEAAARFFEQSEEMRAVFELMNSDQDGGQGPGYWKTYLALAFPRLIQSPGYTFEDLRKISAPTLILAGDRDQFCSPEEGVTAYRMLQDGELAILPDTGHLITPAVVKTTIEFFERRLASPSGSTPAAG